ncbi:MAG: hypothetical protein IT379_39525 [Deltaproteobacteria bacterium]|nr:hypothetical protein [Deltaproteobacteria bacterium]
MSGRVRHCVHDRAREGCDECDRIVLSQRRAALLVLGLDDEDLDVVLRVRAMRQLAASDRSAHDGRPAPVRIAVQRDYARNVAAGHRTRAASTGGLDRVAHEAASATWSTEADLLEGLLELLGHTPSVTRKPSGDQA